MNKYYPLKFEPIYKDKIWGGNKIKTILGKDYDLPNCGESWELSGVEGNISIVANGPLKGESLIELVRKEPAQILGNKFAGRSDFPLLIKFLDANDDLSIQVHPNDELAKKKHNGSGKTEMWYIIDADPGAELISGFSEKIDKDIFLRKCEEGTILESLNKEEVSQGDTFFIPSGRIHSIGKGILLAEIQQTSDITYRVYDFDRKGTDGKPRELHIDEAAEALNFNLESSYRTSYDRESTDSTLVDSPFFTTRRMKGNNEFIRNLSEEDSFRIYIVISGKATFRWDEDSIPLTKGEVYLIPAVIKNFTIMGSNEFCGLEVFIR